MTEPGQVTISVTHPSCEMLSEKNHSLSKLQPMPISLVIQSRVME